MRKTKEKTVTLVTPKGSTQAFSISHAERLLDMGEALNGGWRIPEDSDYYYDEEYGIRFKSNKANNFEAREEANNSKGDSNSKAS